MSKAGATLAILGGSGFYSLDGLKDAKEERVSTPFGDPSDTILSATLEGMRVLFLARHGRSHSLLPGEINYRANIMALKMLGAAWCLSISAVGSLKEHIHPGDIVIPDQLIDRTHRGNSSFFGAGVVAHVAFAEPYCPVLRECLREACLHLSDEARLTCHSGGTLVCMEGPAFSTRAESNLHRQFGADLIGMTALPEARLAREAELAYATMALVTDYDCWKDDGSDVTAHGVAEVMKQNSANAAAALRVLARLLPEKTPSPLAADALRGAIFSDLRTAPAAAIERLKPIIGRYLI